LIYDDTVAVGEDPYWQNPLETAVFQNLVSYKNGRNGAIAERVGAVQFHNFKTADNILAGIEFSLTEDVADGHAKIVGGVIIGKTSNTEALLDAAMPHGIITPRTENFRIEGTTFHKFDWNNAAAFGTCSHCFHDAATDSGARQVTTTGLVFASTVTKKIRYQLPWRAIFHDEDGSLTGQGVNSWATPAWKHNAQDTTACSIDDAVYDGIVCDGTVEVRRLAFYGYSPKQFDNMAIKITQYDTSVIDAMTPEDKTLYVDDVTSWSAVPFKSKLKPTNGWAVPFVTGHRYRVHWAEGLDFTRMKVELSSRWTDQDQTIGIVMNHTDVREAVNFTLGYGSGDQIANTTLTTKAEADWLFGDNHVYNETETREFHFAVNAKDPLRKDLLIEGIRCLGGCLSAIEEIELGDAVYWSSPDSWDSGVLPVEGETVEIKSGVNMILDLPETPILKMLTVNGRLSFLQQEGNPMDINLHAYHIFVRAGEFFIGSEEVPFANKATITLYGES